MKEEYFNFLEGEREFFDRFIEGCKRNFLERYEKEELDLDDWKEIYLEDLEEGVCKTLTVFLKR